MLNLLSSLTQFSGRAGQVGQALGVLPQHPCLWPIQSIPGGIRSSARLVRRSLPQVRTTLHPTCGFKGWVASCDIHGCQPVSVTPPSPRTQPLRKFEQITGQLRGVSRRRQAEGPLQSFFPL